MAKGLPLLSLKERQGGNRVLAAKSQRMLCGLSVMVLMSSCGGGDDGGGSPAPQLTVTAQTLYSFGGISTDAMGGSGDGVLIEGSDGNLYGTTARGGLAECPNGAQPDTDPLDIGCGAVFKITPAGEETVLHLFAKTPADGAYPEVLIQGSDGNFYGTTRDGGANGLGTVFRLTPEGVETMLYSFKAGSDGAGGLGLAQGSDGNFYGTTSGGGVHNVGTVFKLTPEGVETVLYTFAGAPEGANGANDGAYPYAQLIQGSNGNFYGLAEGGLPCGDVMDPFGCGVVFEVTPDGIETVVHEFSGPDGAGPSGLIQGRDGNFYGTTSGGGHDGEGTAFEVTPDGVETTLHVFVATDGDGVFPFAQLTQATDGNFYGTTYSGGINEGGTMFQLTPAGVLTVLYSFPNTSGPDLPGAEPDTNLVQGSDGNLYGAATQGGAYHRGYFFRLTLK